VTPSRTEIIGRVCAEIRRGHRFLITSHARPDGDSIGSQLALALTLDRLGKTAKIVNRDSVPQPYLAFPGAGRIEVAEAVAGEFDALFVMECGDLLRPGVAGLDRYRIVNIDHHVGNTGFGDIRWFDESAAACGEMVADLVDALGVAWTADIALNLYATVLTDTGSFRHSHITARTFEIGRRAAAVGVDPAETARQIYDSGSTGRLKLIGSLLDTMRLEAAGRVAVLCLDDGLLQATGATYDDADGVINLPLTAREVKAVTMFKLTNGTGELRVSLRSKAGIDVRSVAERYGGGGHKNAAGFTAPANDAATRAEIVRRVAAAVEQGSAEQGGAGLD
jgi:phosphoesterase RecJ-like protein